MIIIPQKLAIVLKGAVWGLPTGRWLGNVVQLNIRGATRSPGPFVWHHPFPHHCRQGCLRTTWDASHLVGGSQVWHKTFYSKFCKGLPLWLSWKRICLQCRRPWFDSWVRKRALGGGHRNPLQYSFPNSPHRQRGQVGYSPWGRKDWSTKHSTGPARPKWGLELWRDLQINPKQPKRMLEGDGFQAGLTGPRDHWRGRKKRGGWRGFVPHNSTVSSLHFHLPGF